MLFFKKLHLTVLYDEYMRWLAVRILFTLENSGDKDTLFKSFEKNFSQGYMPLIEHD